MLLTNYGINHHILKRDVNHVIIEVVGSLKKKKSFQDTFMTALFVKPFTPWISGQGRQAKDTSILTFARLSWQTAWGTDQSTLGGLVKHTQCILKLLNQKEKPLVRPRTNLFPEIKHTVLWRQSLWGVSLCICSKNTGLWHLTMNTCKSSSFFYWDWSLWISPWGWGAVL